ncbi:MAG: long-chain fatty acid--CoA ligase [Dehalococcoidia bacterium]
MTEKFSLKELSKYKVGTWADVIYRNALLHSDKEAFIYEDKRITFADYNARINKMIRGLNQMGVKKGDVLGILSWSCLEFVEIYGLTMKAGFIASPFNPRLGADELEYLVKYSGTDTLFVGKELVDMANTLKSRLPQLKNLISLETAAEGMKAYDDILKENSGDEPDIDPDEDDPCCIIYTSGTTGVPRGALYTQRRFIDDSRTLVIDMGLQEGHRRIQITPLFHIAGNTHFRSSLYTVGSNTIVKFFDAAETLKIIQREKATHMDSVPTHLAAILNLPDLKQYDISSLEYFWYGGSPMPQEVLKRGMEVFGPIFAQGFGQSESGPAICHLSKEDHDVLDKPPKEQQKLASTGRPDIGVQVRIVDDDGKDLGPDEVGEILVRSNHTMIEYWKKPEKTQETLVDGWLHTGDMGYYDEEGYIYIADRKKDMIISGGENVYPREVEEVLYRHPAVLEAAVIGIPDEYWVEKVHAVIALKKGVEATADDIKAFCKKNIAGYKTPKSIEFVAVLPKNAAGKILKRELREKFWEGTPQEKKKS